MKLFADTFGAYHIGTQRSGSMARLRPHAPRTLADAADRFGAGAEIALVARDGTRHIYIVPAEDRANFEKWAAIFCLRDGEGEPDGTLDWQPAADWLPPGSSTADDEGEGEQA